MSILEFLVELIKYAIPAGAAILGMRYTQELFISREDGRLLAEAKRDALAKLLPLRLSAYERMVLYMERISPQNLLLRESPAGKNVALYRDELLLMLHTEFEHNLVQQLYIQPKTWATILAAKDEMQTLVTAAAQQAGDAAPAIALSNALVAYFSQAQEITTQKALAMLRFDVQQMGA